MRRAILLAALLAAAPVRAEQSLLRLDQTDPAHLRGDHKPPLDNQPLPAHPVMIKPRAVYTFPDGVAAVAKPDAALSELCNRLAFKQEVDRYFWARTKDRNYGVAFPTGGSLLDLNGKAKPGKVYIFDEQDANCTVFVGEIAKLMPYYIKN